MRVVDVTAGVVAGAVGLRAYYELRGRMQLRKARRTPSTPGGPTVLEMPDGPMMLVDAHGLNWPVGEPIAHLFHSTGNPLADLEGWKRLNRLQKEHESDPMFVIRAPVFPPPEDQQAANDGGTAT